MLMCELLSVTHNLVKWPRECDLLPGHLSVCGQHQATMLDIYYCVSIFISLTLPHWSANQDIKQQVNKLTTKWSVTCWGWSSIIHYTVCFSVCDVVPLRRVSAAPAWVVASEWRAHQLSYDGKLLWQQLTPDWLAINMCLFLAFETTKLIELFN